MLSLTSFHHGIGKAIPVKEKKKYLKRILLKIAQMLNKSKIQVNMNLVAQVIFNQMLSHKHLIVYLYVYDLIYFSTNQTMIEEFKNE